MDRDLILNSTRDLQERFVLRRNKSSFDDKTLSHIHRGFIVRVMMIQHAAVDIDVDLGEATEPLSSYKSIELSLLLNSFYLNLCGSLDNLAWAMAFHHRIKPDLNESNRGDQHLVGLFKEKFLSELEQTGLVELAQHIRELRPWNADLKAFRDPGAHRIPLFVPMAIYSEKDIKKRSKLDSIAAVHYAQNADEKGREAFAEMNKLGTYYPVFISENSQTEIYHAGAKLTEDFRIWYRLVDEIFTAGLSLPKLSNSSRPN